MNKKANAADIIPSLLVSLIVLVVLIGVSPVISVFATNIINNPNANVLTKLSMYALFPIMYGFWLFATIFFLRVSASQE